MFFEKPKRRHILPLNIIPLIDICSMIIIFLVMDSFFGVSSIAIPDSLSIPTSLSRENVDNAPSAIMIDGGIKFTGTGDVMTLQELRAQGAPLAGFREKLKTFVNSLPADARRSGVLLNLVADQTAPYRDIFDTISVFREAGFQSILFVAKGEEK